MGRINKIKNTILVAAGKGGVGKSTVAVNLARAFSYLGAKVGILDADLYGPSLRLMVPEDHLPQHDGEWIIPARSQKLKLMSMAYFEGHKASIMRAPKANAILKQFIDEVQWGELDYLIIDLPPGTGDIHLTLMQEVSFSGAILVTTPQQVSLLDVKKALEMLNLMKVPILGIVENMSYFQDGQSKIRYYPLGKGGGAQLAEEFKLELLAEIPLNSFITQSGDSGVALSEMEGSFEVFQNFLQLSSEIEVALFKKKYELGIFLENFHLVWENRSIEKTLFSERNHNY